jgi:hypothetical protein
LTKHWAGSTNRFGQRNSVFASRSAFTLGMKEDLRVFSTACPFELPVPQISVWAWKTGYISHVFPFVRSNNFNYRILFIT